MLSRLVLLTAAVLATALPTAAEASSETRPTAPPYVVHRVETNDPVVFITIDDGFTITPGAERLLKSVPHMNFVLRAPLERHGRFFKASAARGVSYGNHTANHRNMRALSQGAQQKEICAGRDAVVRTTGATPTLFRPPFGAWKKNTPKAARACGMKHLVLWNVVADKGVIRTWGNAPIRRGDIILMHYIPSLESSLQKLLVELRRLGLRPADLAAYLS